MEQEISKYEEWDMKYQKEKDIVIKLKQQLKPHQLAMRRARVMRNNTKR